MKRRRWYRKNKQKIKMKARRRYKQLRKNPAYKRWQSRKRKEKTKRRFRQAALGTSLFQEGPLIADGIPDIYFIFNDELDAPDGVDIDLGVVCDIDPDEDEILVWDLDDSEYRTVDISVFDDGAVFLSDEDSDNYLGMLDNVYEQDPSLEGDDTEDDMDDELTYRLASQWESRQMVHRVATAWRFRVAKPNLREILKEMDKLNELSENLTEVENQVSNTFKMAASLNPEIRTQKEALKKAVAGHQGAQNMLNDLREILKLYPDDKTAQRAVKDAQTLVKRFAKHESEARKIIKQLSKKGLPPALSKMAKELATMIKKHLVNPSDLDIRYQQGEAYSRDWEGVKYVVLFSLSEGNQFPKTIGLEETTLRPGVYPAGNERNTTTAKEALEKFLIAYQGSPLIKGQEGANKKRKEILDALGLRLSRMTSFRDLVKKDLSISGEFRDFRLPKDGAYEMGEYEYEDLLKTVMKGHIEDVKKAIAPYEKDIRGWSISPEEKSWLYLTINLK